jgi:hypothetical protein
MLCVGKTIADKRDESPSSPPPNLSPEKIIWEKKRSSDILPSLPSPMNHHESPSSPGVQRSSEKKKISLENSMSPSHTRQYETISFAPGTIISPSRIHNADEKLLLVGLSCETKHDMRNLLKSPSYLHRKYPEEEAKKLKQRWLNLLKERVNAENTAVSRARAASSMHLLLLRVLGKTCKVPVYNSLLNQVADFYCRVFSEVYVGALGEKKLVEQKHATLIRHTQKQHHIIMRHIHKMQYAKNLKIAQSILVAWHAEVIGKNKKRDQLQKIFHRNSRKIVLQNVFRQWYTAMKNWLKARRQAEGNLSVLDGRRDAESRVLECHAEIFKLRSQVEQLTKIEKKLRETDARRLVQLRDAQQETSSLLNLLDSVVYETKKEAEAAGKRPLTMRLDYLKAAVNQGYIRRVPRSQSIGTNTDKVVKTRKTQRPASATTHSSCNSKQTETVMVSTAISSRNVPKCVLSFAPDLIVPSLREGGHVTV